jgi:hypothetical protein
MMNSPPRAHGPGVTDAPPALRRAAATLLRETGARLVHLAHQLAKHDTRSDRDAGPARLEFHAEAGAPEGALYADGRLVRRLEGVRRL